MKTNTHPPLLNAKSASEYLNLTERYLLHDRGHKRTIPFIKINHLVRYDLKDLEAFKQSAKIGGGVL